ncbi:MAG: hypothetical protein ACYC6C_03160 [Coriobacteriia bacterium]
MYPGTRKKVLTMLLRNTLIGAAAFGLAAAAAGYIWTAFEFPFVIIVPAVLGWYLVARMHYVQRTALWAALLGGATFTAAFMVAVFFALTDGSPVAPTPWMAATFAAIAAGAVTGALLGGWRGSRVIALFAGVGMLLATAMTGVLRAVAPESVDVAGQTQYLYFASVLGVVGAIVGAAAGAGVAWLKLREPGSRARPRVGPGRPHAA